MTRSKAMSKICKCYLFQEPYAINMQIWCNLADSMSLFFLVITVCSVKVQTNGIFLQKPPSKFSIDYWYCDGIEEGDGQVNNTLSPVKFNLYK
jgi:hypothetical protein